MAAHKKPRNQGGMIPGCTPRGGAEVVKDYVLRLVFSSLLLLTLLNVGGYFWSALGSLHGFAGGRDGSLHTAFVHGTHVVEELYAQV